MKVIMKKLPGRFANLLFAFFLTIAMVFVVTGVSTAVTVGFPADFFWRWGKAWFSAWLVAFPAAYFIAPRVRQLVSVLTRE
jgi:hypothetical protein